jgi:hypothetical protein
MTGLETTKDTDTIYDFLNLKYEQNPKIAYQSNIFHSQYCSQEDAETIVFTLEPINLDCDEEKEEDEPSELPSAWITGFLYKDELEIHDAYFEEKQEFKMLVERIIEKHKNVSWPVWKVHPFYKTIMATLINNGFGDPEDNVDHVLLRFPKKDDKPPKELVEQIRETIEEYKYEIHTFHFDSASKLKELCDESDEFNGEYILKKQDDCNSYYECDLESIDSHDAYGQNESVMYPVGFHTMVGVPSVEDELVPMIKHLSRDMIVHLFVSEPDNGIYVLTPHPEFMEIWKRRNFRNKKVNNLKERIIDLLSVQEFDEENFLQEINNLNIATILEYDNVENIISEEEKKYLEKRGDVFIYQMVYIPWPELEDKTHFSVSLLMRDEDIPVLEEYTTDVE